VAAKVKEVGADALLLARLVDRKTVQEYVPGTPYYPPMSYRNWQNYYGGYSPAYSPGYTTEIVYTIAEANLYDTATGKIVWSAVTETEMSGNDQKAIRSYASELLEAMRKQELIG
jgi:hypothetical protein